MSEGRLHVYLFTDLVGSTDLKRRLGDVEGAAAIAAHDHVFRVCLKQYGGTEQNNPGDGFFATFALPSAALQCALAFHTGLRDLDLPEPIRARVGIHMGESVRVAGDEGPHAPAKLLGLAIDFSGRIMSLAEGNQILLTRHVYDSVRQQLRKAPDGSPIEWCSHGSFVFKGAEEPLEVFEAGIAGLSPLRAPKGSAKAKRVFVAAAVSAERKPRRNRARRDTKLYGRDEDLARLRKLFDLAANGDGQAVLLQGEAGIGKTRLVEEFLDTLDDVNVLVGAYEPAGAATMSGAYTRAFHEYFGPDLENVLPAYLPETPRLVPAFAALIRGDAPPEGTEPLTQESLQTVVVQAARNLSRERPTVFLIDDLHFAPELGRTLFASLAYALPEHRLLLLGTTRPGLPQKWVAQLTRLDHYTTHALRRLAAADVEQLAAELAADDAFRARVAHSSEGVPYFAVEILRAGADVEIPDSVQELIQARVGALEDEDRELLQVGSCCGSEFDPLLVGEVVGLDRRLLLKRFVSIEQEHRLVQFSDDRCAFDHHQVQEVLYASLPGLLRREYHTLLAEAYARRCGEEPKGDDAFFLTHHHLRGSRPKDALAHLEPAFHHLQKNYRNETMLDVAARVKDLLEGRERVEVLLREVGRLDLLGRRDEQCAALDEAVALADETGEEELRSKTRRSLGAFLYALSDHDAAQAAFVEALALARAAGDKQLEAEATGNLGSVDAALGRYAEAQAHHERHRTLSRDIGDRQGEATATGNLGMVFLELGRYAEAQEHFERHRALSREIGDRQGEATATGRLGIVFANLGCHAEAKEHFERHRALSREIGSRQGEAQATGNLGNVFSDLGRYSDAMELHERASALSREIGNRRGEAIAIGNLGIIFWSLGRYAEAKEHFERHGALSREIGDRRGEARATGNLGIVFTDLGRFAQAKEHHEHSRELSREVGDRHGEGFSLASLAGLAEAEEDAEGACSLCEQALALRRELGEKGTVAETLVVLGRLEAARGETESAAEFLDEALVLARETKSPGTILAATVERARLPGGDADAVLAALAEHEERVRRAEKMKARFWLWELTQDKTHLAEAHRLLAFMRDHAPEQDRDSMIENVPLHKDIMKAWDEHGAAEQE